MRSFRHLRFARWAAFAALTVAAFEACSNSGDSTPIVPGGPESIAITPPGMTLDCDNSLVVQLTLTNWFLRPPFDCGTQEQCGSVQVTLLETEDGPALNSPSATARAATADVQFDLTALVSPPTADAPTLSQVHFIKAELLGDSLLPFNETPGGTSSQTIAVSLMPGVDCSSASGGASSGGAAGAGGAASGAAGAAVDAGGAAGVGGSSTSGGGTSGGGTSGGGGGQAPASGAGGEAAASGSAPL